MKFVKKIIYYFLNKRNNKSVDDLDMIIKLQEKEKDPFIYR